jgi:hypothetical protein
MEQGVKAGLESFDGSSPDLRKGTFAIQTTVDWRHFTDLLLTFSASLLARDGDGVARELAPNHNHRRLASQSHSPL